MQLVEEFRRLPAYDLTIVGGGKLQAEVRRAAAGCSNIRVLGEQPRQAVIELFQQATAAVLPALGPETSPLAVVEAMACATPVVVREAGGSAESVEATGGGVVYRKSEELAPALRRIAEDPQWRESLATKARQGYLERYTPAVHLRRYLGIIRSLQAF
jgi:glycosyltransferase involved in cell wall biosynthesis